MSDPVAVRVAGECSASLSLQGNHFLRGNSACLMTSYVRCCFCSSPFSAASGMPATLSMSMCLSVCLPACSMCIRQIQHESVVCVCIKLVKYVHVNAFRAAFCAAIIKFLIVAFYSHVSSRQADTSADQRTSRPDQQTSKPANQRTNGPTDRFDLLSCGLLALLEELIEQRRSGVDAAFCSVRSPPGMHSGTAAGKTV